LHEKSTRAEKVHADVENTEKGEKKFTESEALEGDGKRIGWFAEL